MIRPYWSVLVDSFRAAFASRVLWIALLAIYLFLAALAPIGQHEVFTTTFRWSDFSNGTRLKAMLARGIAELEDSGVAAVVGDQPAAAADEPGQETADAGRETAAAERETAAGRIARHLPAELQRDLTRVSQGQEVRIRLDILADGLNSLYESNDWYDTQVWAAVPRLRELRELDALAEDDLTDQLRKRQARLRIEAALPGVLENRGARSLSFTYAGMDFPAQMQIEKSQFQTIMNHFVLRMIIEWILGFAMIFLGILVTASIIPDMLQAGSLHLLLSKPLSRPWLFLTKFLGGCAFVLVCVTQLILGLWLIGGLRLEMWNHRLLLCIPVCVFLFAVFYSVSAIAGLKWRSPILAIGVANLFGAFCLIVWTAGGLFDGLVMDPDRITGLTTSPHGLVAATQGGKLQRFDEPSRTWINLFPEDNGRSDRVLAPVRFPNGVVASGRVRGGRMNVFGSGATPLLLLEPGGDGLQPPLVPAASIELPAGTLSLAALGDGSLLVHNSGDLMLAPPQAIRSAQESATATDAAELTDAAAPAAATSTSPTAGGWLPKLLQMMGGPVDGFNSLLPEQFSLSSPSAVAVDSDERLYLFSAGTLMCLQRPSVAAGSDGSQQRWQTTATTEAMPAGPQAWLLRLSASAVLLLQSERPPRLYDPQLEPLSIAAEPLAVLEQLSIQTAISCPGSNTAAVLASNGTVWLVRYDESSGGLSVGRLPGAGSVEAMHWAESDQCLWLAHHTDRVSSWQFSQPTGLQAELTAGDWIASWARTGQTFSPSLTGWRKLQRYVVAPLRVLTPQTGELGDTIAGLVSGEDAVRLPSHGGVEATVARYQFWRPLLTCSGFLALMLAFGCYYFAKTDF